MRTTSSSTTTAEDHYKAHSAESYEQAFFYEAGAYTERLCSLVQDRLQLKAQPQQPQQKRLLDIGGGTGSFTRMLVKETNVSAVVVDPFLEKSSEADDDKDDSVRFVAEPAEAFMKDVVDNSDPDDTNWWRSNYDFVLLKEVAHHFAEADREPIFRGMWKGLRPTSSSSHPSLLLITRPQYEIDYPLWDEARHVWAQNQPSLKTFVSELRRAGFCDIQHTIEPYPCSVPLGRWQSMVKSRFWSTFSHFSDEQLETACETIAENEKHRIKDGVIMFEDRLLFISAKKI